MTTIVEDDLRLRGRSGFGVWRRLCSHRGGRASIVVLVVVMRLLSVKFSIMLPGAVKRHNTYLPSESRYLKRPVIHPDAHDGGDDDKDQSRD